MRASRPASGRPGRCPRGARPASRSGAHPAGRGWPAPRAGNR
ncbi:hypothetical protein MGSAQ_003031 [marine sediment metagenome]|uniref:Uncharacterized protein n=1 Tax=marine sediment metagenome TaxID=412755 RepID=A0A1B6NQ40_9ZZZZ